MTSQAYGRHDLNEVTRLLLRSVGVGLFIAFTLLALQYPIERTAFTFIQTTEEVEHLASLYFLYLYLGSTGCIRALQFCRLVYRYAKFPFPHVYSHHTKYSEHCGQSSSCIWIRNENRRCRHRNVNCTICRASHGIFVVVTLLQHPAETHRMAFLL